MKGDPMAGAPLPPGETGLPILGETLTLLKNGFAFVEAGARKHGPIFQSKLFGRATAVITGPGASALFIDSDRVQRSGSMPAHIQTLFAGRSLPLLDGNEHRDRKHFVMAAFTREALASYLPTMQRLVSESIGQWSARPEARLFDEFKRLAIETIAVTMLGVSRGPTLDRVLADYGLVGGGFANLPIPLPGTAYTRAKQALARILAVFETCIREHQASPKDDGLSRILAARTGDGRGISIEDAKRELHHIVVAGLIVWAWFVGAILELSKRSDLLERLRDEIRARCPEGPLTLETLGKMHELQWISMEIRRLSPVVYVFFGKARETFEFEGFTVPKGWAVLWGHRSSHIRPEIYSEPEEFDPSRFSPSRAEHLRHEHAFVPNGAGPPTGHKCAGYEFAPLFLQVFLVELYRAFDVEIARPQDLGLDWSRVPPEPREGLRASVKRR
jgi:cytochrome P450